MQTDSTIPLSVRGLTIRYGQKAEPVVQELDYDTPAGQMIAVMGPNGAGKSSVIKGALGLVSAQYAALTFFGVSLDKARSRVSYMAQRQDIDWSFPISVLDVVLMGLSSQLGFFGRVRARHKEMAENALRLVHMQDFRASPVGTLSGGQQQRVFLARALVQNPELYILDEPLSGIDLKAQEIILETLIAEKHKGKTILCVHHDLHSAPHYFDSGLLINRTAIASGPIGDVLTQKNLDEAYGVLKLRSSTHG